jgi:hypothetical protein
MANVKCVLCDQEATETAAQIPVCGQHREQYDTEGRKYLPLQDRTFYRLLISVWEAREGRCYFS